MPGLTLFQWSLIFYVYSAIGWLSESIWCAMGTKKWVNRGFLHGPWCPVYGFGGVIAVVLTKGMTAYPLLVFLVVMAVLSALEYFTGWLMESLFHTTWWDYSNRKFNLKGRICLRNSLLFGLMGLGTVYFIHPKGLELLKAIPLEVQAFAAAFLSALFLLDLLTSLGAVTNLQEKLKHIRLSLEAFASNPQKYSWFDKKDLQGSIGRLRARHAKGPEDANLKEAVEKMEQQLEGAKGARRLVKAYPDMKPKGFALELETLKKGLEEKHLKGKERFSAWKTQAKAKRRHFWAQVKASYKGVTLTRMIWVFIIACVVGFVVETLWCLVTRGVIESRKGLIYGPFSQVYGMGAVILLLVLTPFAAKGDGWLFFTGALVGGLYEAVCSLVQEKVFGSVSWEYSEIPFSLLGGRTHLLYMLFWGILTIVYMKHIYPWLIRLIDRIPDKSRTFLTWFLSILLVLNMGISALAVGRWAQRLDGVQASNQFETWLDQTYPDQRLEKIYANMVFTNKDD